MPASTEQARRRPRSRGFVYLFLLLVFLPVWALTITVEMACFVFWNPWARTEHQSFDSHKCSPHSFRKAKQRTGLSSLCFVLVCPNFTNLKEDLLALASVSAT